MKRVLIGITLLSMLGISCDKLKSENDAVDSSAVEVKELGLAAIKFDTPEHDFGIIKEGDTAKYVFEFTNVGENPLLIQSAKPSCGCTTPDITKDTLPPGGRGKMTVMFNSNGRPGKFNKSVNVLANTDPEITEVKIMGSVTPKPEVIDGPFKK
ncbi:MAG: DUF1573 domain-containing protein [Cytophagaceae bacterium]